MNSKIHKIFPFLLSIIRYRLPAALVFALIFNIFCIPVQAQENNNEAGERFISLGPISYSSEYIVGEDASYIVFRIRNNTFRTIREIFGWVYNFKLEENNLEGAKERWVLVNNPHRGGMVIRGEPHRPGTIAEWRFPMLKLKAALGASEKYSLRVSPKGIFYASVEPPPPPASTKNSKEN